ncbi:MAG: M15 family metallopeptidase [Hyphomicrobiaceae bacterium]|nr:M15 family metallopeptidase [Hyphomicrobiaceae bacterium]
MPPNVPSRRLTATLWLVLLAALPAAAQQETAANRARLVAAYPDVLERADGDTLIWRDGTRTPFSDGRAKKPFATWLSEPDLDDIFAIPYPTGEPSAPAKDSDPGRARPAALFDKMYGDCRKGEVEQHLTTVHWLPSRTNQRLRVTRINGVDKKLAAISAELDALPARFDAFLVPAAGTYACRVIAGTDRPSAHGPGIAIDIALKHSHYWRWSKTSAAGAIAWRNDIPYEIVRIFEKHGFIWGGRWYHYDTMHFEYRPELLPPG